MDFIAWYFRYCKLVPSIFISLCQSTAFSHQIWTYLLFVVLKDNDTLFSIWKWCLLHWFVCFSTTQRLLKLNPGWLRNCLWRWSLTTAKMRMLPKRCLQKIRWVHTKGFSFLLMFPLCYLNSICLSSACKVSLFVL